MPLDLRADHGYGLLAPVASFFTGDWSVVRRIRDLRTSELGRLRGTAIFTQNREGIRFSECGVLVLPSVRTEARRDYRFVVESDGSFSVFFDDGRFFHRAEVVAGMALASHDCAPDLYCGRYRFARADLWSLSWRITGPRKNLVMSTVFSRTGRRQ